MKLDMSLSQQQLIDKLKRQPRHGMANPLTAAALILELKAAAAAAAPALVALDEPLVQLGLGLEVMASAAEKTAKTFTDVTEASLYLELRNKELNKTFGINSTKAADFK
jgi:hypothetical protein